jgi:hypothetical protein
MAQPAAADPALASVFRRPFAEQLAFFRGKLDNLVPTARWNDIWKIAHDRAFMVAGAAKAELLADLAGAVDKAIAEGETLDAFRKRFAEIVERHGWHGWTGEATKAGRAWRTRIIYQTNLSTSYAAGRLAQLKDAGFKLWVYRHSGAEHPRQQHLAWDGLTLPADHPFWQTHYPPSGWGCRCRVVGANGPEGAKRLGGNPDYSEPPAGWDSIDPKTGEPPGIDKGWGYMPGATVAGDVARAVARKTVAWPYEAAKAYMADVPVHLRDALALAIRSQPETGEAARRYAERALGVRNGAPIEGARAEPYLTLGLLTGAEADTVARLTGIEALGRELYDWTVGQYAPRHILKEHGDASTEAARGQRVPTAEDYARIPAIIAAPDRIWTDDGSSVLMEKKFATADGGEERMLLVWEPLKKRRMLTLRSVRIYRRNPRAQRP